MENKAFTTWTSGPLCSSYTNHRGELIGAESGIRVLFSIIQDCDSRHILYVPYWAESRTYRPGRHD